MLRFERGMTAADDSPTNTFSSREIQKIKQSAGRSVWRLSFQNMASRFRFWRAWLIVASWAAAGFGLALALFNQTPLFDVILNSHVDPAFWPIAPRSPPVARFEQFVYGIMGAMLVGWGLMMALIAMFAFSATARAVWWGFVLSLLVWYSLDTAISLICGVRWNAALNSFFLVMLGIPLAATVRTVFRGAEA
jgi:hypothetical protein